VGRRRDKGRQLFKPLRDDVAARRHALGGKRVGQGQACDQDSSDRCPYRRRHGSNGLHAPISHLQTIISGEFPKNLPCKQGPPAVPSADFRVVPSVPEATAAATARVYRTVSPNRPSIRKE